MTTPHVSRRQFVSSVAAGVVAATVPGGRANAATEATWKDYASATVIDALGGPGNANKPGAALDAADLADVRASGLTVPVVLWGRGAM